MALGRTCTECGTPLQGRQKFTCKDGCRAARSRRLKRISQDNGRMAELPPHQQAVAEAVRVEAPDIAHRVIQEEIRPVVREAMTEDVLQAINAMVGLAPQAIGALAVDLASDDSKVRQKAYDLWLRYTVGHTAIVRPEDSGDDKNLVVHFNLPRPDQEALATRGREAQEESESDAHEVRTCNLCGEDKPVEQFIAASDRCEDCHDKMARKVEELLAE